MAAGFRCNYLLMLELQKICRTHLQNVGSTEMTNNRCNNIMLEKATGRSEDQRPPKFSCRSRSSSPNVLTTTREHQLKNLPSLPEASYSIPRTFNSAEPATVKSDGRRNQDTPFQTLANPEPYAQHFLQVMHLSTR